MHVTLPHHLPAHFWAEILAILAIVALILAHTSAAF